MRYVRHILCLGSLAAALAACSSGGGGGGGNDAPLAIDDTAETNEDTAVEVAVLANDSDEDDDVLFIAGFTDGASGVVSLAADGRLFYAPDVGFAGSDAFTYTVSDGRRDASASVTVTVHAVGDVPVGIADQYELVEDTPFSVSPVSGLLGNDVDSDSSDLEAVLLTDASHGDLSLAADGGFTYTPDADFEGLDSFTYEVTDGAETSASTVVTLHVLPVADAPIAVPDALDAIEDTPLVVSTAEGLLANDTDPDGVAIPLFALVASPPAKGSLSLAGDGSLVYTPDADATGADDFTYVVSDGLLDSAPQTVTIEIGPVPDAPVAADDEWGTREDIPITVAAPGVLANDSDVDTPMLAAVLVGDPSNGEISLLADGSFDYTPDPGFHGSDSFTYQATDGALQSVTRTVSITVGPSASTQIASVRAAPDSQDLALEIEGAWVTYVKPAVGSEPAGFFLQATQAGPAIFVAADVAVSAGDEVSAVVSALATVGGMRRVTGLSSLAVTSVGHDVAPLVQDLGGAADLVTAIDDYEAELVTVAGSTPGSLSLEDGFRVGAFETSAVASPSLEVRVAGPPSILQRDCDATVGPAPLWRADGVAQVTAWSASEVTGLSCAIEFSDMVTNMTNPFLSGPGTPPVWSYEGQIGLDAGNDVCKDIGLHHVCSHEEMERASALGHLSGVPDGQKFWLYRLTEVTVGFTTYLPGPQGTTCNLWTGEGAHAFDGEWGVVNGGVISYLSLDPNPCLSFNGDGCAQAGEITCWDGLGGPRRAIPCCYP